MLLSRALVMSAAMSPRYLTRPLLAQRAAALSMASPDIAAFTKEMWSEVTAAGQTKDADKVCAAANIAHFVRTCIATFSRARAGLALLELCMPQTH